MKKLPLVPIIIVLLLISGGVIVYQKSQFKAPAALQPTVTVKKIDLTTQPKWVQDLVVTAVKGRSANGLDNVTITVKGLPAGLVSTVNYVVQYQTTNKGTQGALSSKPIDVSGAVTFTKVIDFGTCSTKSCVRHEGVTSVDLELDFTITSGDTPVWEKTLGLT